jgi:hypothetical protein
MKIGLYSHGLNDLLLEIAAHLYEHELQMSKNCLCHEKEVSELDVIILHPEYNNKTGCWTRIKELIEKNPKTQFYLMSDATSERMDFFGKISNLFYVGITFSLNESISPTEFYKNPLKFLEENRIKK